MIDPQYGLLHQAHTAIGKIGTKNKPPQHPSNPLKPWQTSSATSKPWPHTGTTAHLRLRDQPVVESFQFLGPNEIPAKVSVDVRWTATGPVAHYPPGSTDPTAPSYFAGTFREALAQGTFAGSEAGFSFGPARASSHGLWAEIGQERNGIFLSHP